MLKFVRLISVLITALSVSCSLPSSSDSSSGTTPGTAHGPTVVGDNYTGGTSYPNAGTETATPNTMVVNVNGASCGPQGSQYYNQPCVSVTICSVADATNCQTIDNLLLDTGSYGLRIYSSAITIPMVPIVQGGHSLAECAQFGDGTSLWGAVQYAYVQLGGEKKIAMPIQTVDQDYKTAPDYCAGIEGYPGLGPTDSGWNGILGVGMVATDCPGCTTDGLIGQYYTCIGNDCSQGATVATALQVANPIAMLPLDNNGTILSLPSVGSTGSQTVAGTLYFGVDTRTNNDTTASGFNLTRYAANNYLNFKTVFSTYSSLNSSFIDSGSNGLFFPAPTDNSLPLCGSHSSFFCPSSEQTLTALTKASDSSASKTITFKIGNAITLTSITPYHFVLNNLGGSTGDESSPSFFDWGLPFFLGRPVATGIYAKTPSSHLGSGPYWGY